MIIVSKSLAQDVSESTKGGCKNIPYMYKKMLFVMNSEDGDTPVDKISTQGIEMFDTKTDTESHSLLELGLKRQVL